jgi:amino acid transporter
MLLAVSRLMFAWAEDGIFPSVVARVSPTRHTPDVAIVLSGLTASVGILGSHFAGDFFLGVDILVTSMLVNFALMCASVLALPRHNPEIAHRVTVLPSRGAQVAVSIAGIALLVVFLAVHVWNDLSATGTPWYLRSTPVWIAVMTLASAVYLREMRRLKRSGVDVGRRFMELPPE